MTLLQRRRWDLDQQLNYALDQSWPAECWPISAAWS